MAYNRKLLYTKSFPSWNTPEGNLGNFFDGGAITPIQLVATEINEPGSTITYAVTTGALPTGLTLSSSGQISGTPTGYSENETVNFTITATDDEGETAFRDFNILILVEYEIDFLIVAGGGGARYFAGGGAGGLITSYGSVSGGNCSPENSITSIQGDVFTITVGSGGAENGYRGGNSSLEATGIVSLTAIGGGGGNHSSGPNQGNGGSGGGWSNSWTDGTQSGGSGTACQGFGGGSSSAVYGTDGGSGGGGASASGGNRNGTTSGGDGGDGLNILITGNSVGYAGGGYGGVSGGSNGSQAIGQNGYGGGANPYSANESGNAGVVILRMPTVSYSGNTTGSPTVTTDGSDTILTYTGSGTYTS